MEMTYKKDINHTYIVFQGEKVNTESFQVQMILHNLVEGLLSCSILRMDEKDIWQCECTGLQSLEDYCKTHELGKDDFIWIINQILENVQEMQDFLLDVNSLYLMPEALYFHPEKMRLLCCMVPFHDRDIRDSLKQVLQFLMQYLDPEDNEVASLAYGFFRALSKKECSLESLWLVLYEKQRKWRIHADSSDRKNISGCSNMNNLKKQDAVSDEEKGKKHRKTVKNPEFESDITLKDENIYMTQDDVDERDALLDELFFKRKDGQEMENEGNLWKKRISLDFLKKILYLFPAAAAIFLFLYLVFNSWTMSGMSLMVFAGVIVALQVLSLIFYWKWGREIEEVNPLLELEESSSGNDSIWEKDLEKPLKHLGWKKSAKQEEGTVYLEDIPNKKQYLVRSDTGERFALSQSEMIIGKNKEKAQILLTEPTVSRIHAMITKTGNGCYIQDLNSKNGTYVNGERLPERTDIPLKESDELYIANIRFHLQL